MNCRRLRQKSSFAPKRMKPTVLEICFGVTWPLLAIVGIVSHAILIALLWP